MEAHIPINTSLMNITYFLKDCYLFTSVTTISQSVWRGARASARAEGDLREDQFHSGEVVVRDGEQAGVRGP